ncbi:MAG: hypothetical protein QOI47_326 [Actinomycetota bacterium]|nr:hypothetical protein [Actinomycetota bacterium]
MPSRRPRTTTGDETLDRKLSALLDEMGATRQRDILFELFVNAALLAEHPPDRLDLKIATAALQEMRSAFTMFAPYSEVPKVTIFGSARTHADDPLYTHARELAHGLAEQGWMVVTGAGPGIMAAGMEGAGVEKSIGVLIRLPFEGGANELIAGDDKLIEMRYFFTRKLMLVKESAAFVALPGGFGTLDETFELLTLVQTGKAEQAPIVLLDTPGGTYWTGFERFIDEQVVAAGLVSPTDRRLYRITDSVGDAIAEIEGFYRNYHSMRYVGDRLVVRLQAAPTDAELTQLSAEFADIIDGPIEHTQPFPPEVAGDDHLDKPRIVAHFDRHGFGRLRALIDELNKLPSAPAPGAKPPTTGHQARVDERISSTTSPD